MLDPKFRTIRSAQPAYDLCTRAELACLLTEHEEDLEHALASIDRALKIMQTEFPVWHTRGAILHEMGRLEEALAAFHKARSIAPDETSTYYSEALIHGESNRPSQAIECYTQAIERNPEYLEAIHNRAVLFEDVGRIDDAIRSYLKLASIRPQSENPWLSLGSLLYRQKRFDESVGVLKHAVELAPESTVASYKFGMALAAGGQKAGARAAFERAIQLAQSLQGQKKKRGGANVPVQDGRIPIGLGSESGRSEKRPKRRRAKLTSYCGIRRFETVSLNHWRETFRAETCGSPGWNEH